MYNEGVRPPLCERPRGGRPRPNGHAAARAPARRRSACVATKPAGRGAPLPELPRARAAARQDRRGVPFFYTIGGGAGLFPGRIGPENPQRSCARGLCYFKQSGRAFQSSQDLPASHALRSANAAMSCSVVPRSTAIRRACLCRSAEMRIVRSVLGYVYLIWFTS